MLIVKLLLLGFWSSTFEKMESSLRKSSFFEPLFARESESLLPDPSIDLYVELRRMQSYVLIGLFPVTIRLDLLTLCYLLMDS